MRTLFYKEFKEQFKVAAIAIVVLAILLTIAYHQSNNETEDVVLHGYASGRSDSLQPMISTVLMTEIMFLCGAFGALLGWLQIRAEKHRDLWAFLIHRPIARNQVLWSKIVAGLSLYGLGTIVPLAVFAGAVAIPGHVAAPFRWSMTLPMLAVVLVGIVYYLAGMLTALRRARWFGTRIFGIGPALLTSLVVFSAPGTWQAFAMIPVGMLVSLIAVWGNFRTDGWYRGQAAPSKVILTLICLVSSLMLVALVTAGGVALMLPRSGMQVYTHFQITKEGVVCKITQRGRDILEAVDLEGKPIMDLTNINQVDFYKRMANSQTVQVNFKNDHGFSRYARFMSSSRFFSPWRVADKVLWYLTSDGVLEGYDGLTRRRLSTIVPNAGSGSDGAGGRFIATQDYYYTYFNYSYDQQGTILASSTTLYRIDLGKAEAHPLFTVPPGESIGGFQAPKWIGDGAIFSGVFFVTRQSVRLLDLDGKLKWEAPYVPSYPVYSTVSVHFLQNSSNRFAVRIDPDPFINSKSNYALVSHVEWIDSGGTIVKTEQLPKLPRPDRGDLASDIISAVVIPIPFLLFSNSKSGAAIIVLECAIPIFAVVGWWLGTRYSFSRKAKFGWLVFILLSGAGGLLAFLAVQEWPAREPCPNCRKLRVVDRETCEHCGSKFAPPEMNGTEIFEPLEVG